MNKLNIFVPLTKIDEENRLVYGVVAAEVVDNSGETFDYERSKPYFQKWSMNAELTSNGLSKGNLREMHGKVAAGKLTDISFDDDNKVIECCAKVVDDQAWKKCLEGVYTGFSMGGRYAEKWVEKVAGGSEQKRYAGDPAEISLVDKPCIPTATFQLVKADGMVEEHHFATIIEEDLEKADKEPYGDVKYADPGFQKDGKKRYPIDTEEHIRAAWSYINQTKNADQYSADQVKKIKAKIEAAWRSKIDKAGPPSAEKADTGDMFMTYAPTNDELAARGMQLAKAAGKDSANWLEFADEARAQLVAEKADKGEKGDEEGKKDKADADDTGTAQEGDDKGDFDEDAEKGPKPGGEDDGTPASGDGKNKKDAKGPPKDKKDEKPADKAEKADGDDKEQSDDADADETQETAEKSDSGTGDAVEQGWRAKDGSFHLKKADAIAHNDKLSKGEPETLTGLVGQLAKMVNGDDAETGEEEAEKSEFVKYAEFIEGTVSLLKAEESDNELNKGMWSVERLARALREVGSLTINVSQEAKREGDNSELPGMLGVAVGQLGDTLVAMAKEEVDELVLMVAKDMGGDMAGEVCVSDCYYELAASTLGLEKSDFDELAKAAGAKKSAHVQGIHDRMAKMGAKCAGADMQKMDGADDLAKMAEEMGELRKRAETAEKEIGEAMPLIKTLMADIEKIKALPQPGAPRTSVIEKSDDGKEVQQVRAATADDLLNKFSADDLAMAAIRMGQQHGVTLTSRGANPTGR